MKEKKREKAWEDGLGNSPGRPRKILQSGAGIQLKEKIKPDSPIITATLKNRRKIGHHIRTANVGDAIRNAIRDAGFRWRPYVFRRYFDVRMMQAEADGIIIRDWRQYWMGHSGDIEAVYTVNKGLPEGVIEKNERCLLKGC